MQYYIFIAKQVYFYVETYDKAIHKEEKEGLLNEIELKPSDLAGIYKDIAEVIGVDATLLLHKYFQGQQITLPKKLYAKKYVIGQVESYAGTTNIKVMASKLGYTERHLRQMIKDDGEKRKC